MPKQKTKPKENPKKSRYFKIYATFTLILLLAIAYIIWLFLQRPVVADIRVVAETSNPNADKISEIKTYPGQYVSFTYSGIYAEKSHEIPTSGPVKESIFLSALEVEGQKIAVVVEERETGNFEESPSFQMRENESSKYPKERRTIGDWRGWLFSKDTQVFERTFFTRDQNFLISVSVTSPISAKNLDQELSNVVGSLRFQK